jgi:putative phage-type endonuclease
MNATTPAHHIPTGVQGILTMPQDEYEAWLARSRKGIGGSDVGALLGINRWRSALDVYNSKLELAPPVKQNRDMKRGIVLESVAADEYAEETGRVLTTDPRFVNHPERWYFYGSPDRGIEPCDGRTEPGLLEIKCLRQNGFAETREHGISPDYYAQLQWYLGCSGRQWGSFAVFNAEDWALQHFDIEFDAALFAQMFEAAERFWDEHILPRVAPFPRLPDEALRSQLIGHGAEMVQRTDREWLQAVRAMKRAREEVKLAETSARLAEERVKELMGDAQGAVGGGVKVYWKEQATRRLDTDLLLAEHPYIDLEKYKRQTVSRPFRVYLTEG